MFTSSTATILQSGPLESLGPLAEPPALLVGLVLLAAMVLVGRLVMAVAWRLLLIAIGVVVGLWVLSVLGFQTGLL